MDKFLSKDHERKNMKTKRKSIIRKNNPSPKRRNTLRVGYTLPLGNTLLVGYTL